jgi:hypothetical protein
MHGVDGAEVQVDAMPLTSQTGQISQMVAQAGSLKNLLEDGCILKHER